MALSIKPEADEKQNELNKMKTSRLVLKVACELTMINEVSAAGSIYKVELRQQLWYLFFFFQNAPQISHCSMQCAAPFHIWPEKFVCTPLLGDRVCDVRKTCLQWEHCHRAQR